MSSFSGLTPTHTFIIITIIACLLVETACFALLPSGGQTV